MKKNKIIHDEIVLVAETLMKRFHNEVDLLNNVLTEYDEIKEAIKYPKT